MCPVSMIVSLQTSLCSHRPDRECNMNSVAAAFSLLHRDCVKAGQVSKQDYSVHALELLM